MTDEKKAGPIRMLQNLWRIAAPEVIVAIGYLIMMAWIWTSTYSNTVIIMGTIYLWIVLAEVIYWFGWAESEDTWKYSRYRKTIENKAGAFFASGLLMGVTLLAGWIAVTGLKKIYHNLLGVGVVFLVFAAIGAWIWFNSLKYKELEPRTSEDDLLKDRKKRKRRRKR